MGETDLDNIGAANLEMGGKEISGTEIGVLDGVVPGTAKSSSAAVLDANKEIRGIGIGHKQTLASADGAIAAKTGTVVITKGSAAALTLADPTAGTDDGCRLFIVSATAFAHTVSNAAGSGFNAGGAASDVGTFGGARGDGFEVEAYNGVWYVRNLRNVTLG
jgi:hypothetical protein